MHRYTPLREVFPRPRMVALAGEPVKVGELTLDDLAELDQWLADAAGDPMEDVPPAVCDPDPGTRRRRLVRAWELLAGLPTVGGPGAVAALMTLPGRAVTLLVSGARAGSPIDAETAATRAAECSPAEWAAFERVAWGAPAWKGIARELDPDFESWAESSDEPHDWGRSLAKACEGDPAKLAALGRLTVSQYRLLCRGGEPDWYRCVPKDGETAEQLMERSAAVFRVDEPEEDGPGSIAPPPPELDGQ